METIDSNSKGKSRSLSLVSLAGIIGVIAPGAYLLGFRFYQGFVESYGIDVNHFPLRTPDVYIGAYTAVARMLIDTAGWILSAYVRLSNPWSLFFVFLSIVGAVGAVYLSIKMKKAGKFSNLKVFLDKMRPLLERLHFKNNDLTKSVTYVVFPAYIAGILGYFVMAVAVLWWVLPLFGYFAGQEFAEEQIADYRKNGCHLKKKMTWSTCVSIIDERGNEIQTGIVVAANTENIALFNKNGTYILQRKPEYWVYSKFNAGR